MTPLDRLLNDAGYVVADLEAALAAAQDALRDAKASLAALRRLATCIDAALIDLSDAAPVEATGDSD